MCVIVSGDRAGRRDRRHDRDAARGQRRELLRRAEELHRRHEEPGGQVQRPQIRRQVGKGWVKQWYLDKTS